VTKHQSGNCFRTSPLYLLAVLAATATLYGAPPDRDYAAAVRNGELAKPTYSKSLWYVEAWLDVADPKTGLIPEHPKNDGSSWWDTKNVAADNIAFMALSAYLTDRSIYDGRIMDILRTERRLTAYYDSIPCPYSFKEQRVQEQALKYAIFGAAKCVKDGLLPLVEWLGEGPWSERMIELMDDMWKNAPYEAGPYGRIPHPSHETAGELLQALSRIYWMTGDEKYLNWAIRYGDYFLVAYPDPNDSTKLISHHPTDSRKQYLEIKRIDTVTAPQ
jgi:hypothetical protein